MDFLPRPFATTWTDQLGERGTWRCHHLISDKGSGGSLCIRWETHINKVSQASNEKTFEKMLSKVRSTIQIEFLTCLVQ